MRAAARRAALLVCFWLLAWGHVSVANVASGIVVAAALLVAFPPHRPAVSGPTISPVGTARLVVYVLGQLVPSNVLVTREILCRRTRIRTGVLAYPLQQPSDAVLSLMAHVIALTPGTMTVEATSDPPVLYIHFLLLDDLAEARRTVARLERLAVAALGRPRPQSHVTLSTPRGGA
ncbi:MAG TPA: Na+/H+ antiporter subunit E [Acidimicrobiales bacterium]|nr:Na+/H+ antiporter subunit E [Acidimicrobiales bacterium]